MANQGNQGGGRSNRGFAGMDDEKQREIASKGGSASGGNFANDPQRASEARSQIDRFDRAPIQVPIAPCRRQPNNRCK